MLPHFFLLSNLTKMHYFGLMQYPKEMQFMDAPRNQPLRRSSAPHCPWLAYRWQVVGPTGPLLRTCSTLRRPASVASAGCSVRMQRPPTVVGRGQCRIHARPVCMQLLPATYMAWLCPGRSLPISKICLYTIFKY